MIGHTKSGSPIYLEHHPSHKGFSAGERLQAGDAHGKEIERLRDKREHQKHKYTEEDSKLLAVHEKGFKAHVNRPFRP